MFDFIQTQEQEKLGKLITNVNLMTSQLELHYLEDTDNEIVFRAREMSEMVNEMYLFTRLVLSDTYCITLFNNINFTLFFVQMYIFDTKLLTSFSSTMNWCMHYMLLSFHAVVLNKCNIIRQDLECKNKTECQKWGEKADIFWGTFLKKIWKLGNANLAPISSETE